MDHRKTQMLETERLILRRFTEGDLEAIFKLFKDEDVNTYLPWFPLKSIEEARFFYEERYQKAYSRPIVYRYAICLKTDLIPVGYIHVSTDDSYDFGYGLRKEFWSRGIVTEAGNAAINRLREDGLPYVTATHDINNPRSGQVMKRLGMKYQYTYEEQWQPKNRLVTFRMYQLNLDGAEQRVYEKYWEKSKVHYIEPNP